jgi:hypothetical protein
MSTNIGIGGSQFINIVFYIPTYNELQTTSNTHINSDSAVAQLELTPDKLTPILQDQQCKYQPYELKYKVV